MQPRQSSLRLGKNALSHFTRFPVGDSHFPCSSILPSLVTKQPLSTSPKLGAHVSFPASSPDHRHPGELHVTARLLSCLPSSASKSNQSINHLISRATSQHSFISVASSMAPVTPQTKTEVLKWIVDAATPVVVFSKTTDPQCDRVKNFLASLDIKTTFIEICQYPNSGEIQEVLGIISGLRTVPNVFVKGQHVGGADALLNMDPGKLLALLNGENQGLPKITLSTTSLPNGTTTHSNQSNGTTHGATNGTIITNGLSAPPKKVSVFAAPPGKPGLKATLEQVQAWLGDARSPVVVFSKTTCPFCQKVKGLFTQLAITARFIELDSRGDGAAIQEALTAITGQKTVPNVFVRGVHVGGWDATSKMHAEGKLMTLVNLVPSPSGSAHSLSNANHHTSQFQSHDADGVKFDYDLIVLGGGSGGLATSKEAARLGAKVAVFDFVQPTPIGTTWGLGGTCVNVGCIPKKLMHQAAILGELYEDAKAFGWDFTEVKRHNWDKMVTGIQDYIHSLNWKYKLALRDVNVTYLNSYARFTGPHELAAVNAKGKETKVTSAKFVIATGGRPKYPDIPGAKEYCITSDDLFSLPYPPGKTLCVGASYVSLECGGFLQNLGYDTTVMVRSILLRGFDQQIAERIGEYMEKERKIKFVRGAIPTKIELIEAGTPGRLRVTSDQNGQEIVDEYNTVLFAIGRDPCTNTIGLDLAGVQINPKSGKLDTVNEKTNVPHIYAIGDVLDGKPELTPVAIQAGVKLARRLYSDATEAYDYDMIPTTVFTPLEYGAIGLAEEDALKKYGEDNIEVYHTLYRPLEWTVPGHSEAHCYAKLICHIPDNERVVGLHILGPNSGEITQGFAVGMKLGATKRDFDATTGIHPTQAEIFTTMTVTKRSGGELTASGC